MNTLGSKKKKKVEKPRPRNSNPPPPPVQYVWSCTSTYIPGGRTLKINRDFTLSRVRGKRNETIAGIHPEGKDGRTYRAWHHIGDHYEEKTGLPTPMSGVWWILDWCRDYDTQLSVYLFYGPLSL